MVKYFKKFDADFERVEHENSNKYLEPYVSYIKENNTVFYNKRKYKAFLRYDNSTHLDNTIASALNGVSSNIFCRIYMTNNSQLNFQNNQGMSSTVSLTPQETKPKIILGVNNASGIIVGYGFGGIFYCYDAVCPNCHEHVLSMDANGIATCPNCEHQYDLTNNGLSPQGGRLERYIASTTGQFGVLLVSDQ